MTQAGDAMRGSDFIDFHIAPELSLALNPQIVISPAGSGTKGYEFQVLLLGQ